MVKEIHHKLLGFYTCNDIVSIMDVDSGTSSHVFVLEALQRVCSQNAEILKPAEEKLREWEIQPGFHTILFNTVANHSLDTNLRFQAVLYLKNGIERYWRKNAPNAMSEEEKQFIRQSLLTSFSEPINQIATQKAVIVSKVARIDCPHEWPQLFPTLMHAIENTDTVIQHRALLTLYHVVKVLASKRLAGDRRFFQEFTTNAYSFLLNLWNNYTEIFLREIMQNANAEVIIPNLEKALLCLRILRKMTVFGFYRPHTNQNCLNFLKIIFERAKTSLQCRKQLRGKGIYVLELCEKFIIHLTKILLSVLDSHPFSFVEYIRPSLEFCVYYIFSPEASNLLFERFVIQCFNLIGNILLCAEYKAPKVPSLAKHPETLRAHQIKTAFFDSTTLTEVIKKLVSHYFLLTQDELETWASEPETFVLDEAGENWKYSFRPSMETVFVTIVHEFKNTLTPVLVEMVRETNYLVPPDDMTRILQKDAVYNAVSLASYDLYDELDFDQWFTTTLVQELKIKHDNYRIIRRRAISLIGKWASMKLAPENRQLLYGCAIDLLASNEDMAVRLTASSTLQYAIDDFEFNVEHFKDYLDTAFERLFTLLKEANECDTKMHVLNVMALMVERVGPTIQPHSDALVHYLPLLWQESQDHNMLRCAIVATLVQLVKALGSVSSELNPFLLPIIQLGTDTTQNAIVYLLEDSLELWLTVLENSPMMTNELMQLFNNMPALLDYSTENLRVCLLVVIAQVLLAPELVMRTYGKQIMTVCDSLMSDMRNEGIIVLTRLIETFVKANPEVGAETILPILPRIFHKIGDREEYPMIMSMYLVITSRVLLASHKVFTEALSRLALLENESDQAVLYKILQVWLEKMTHVSQVDHRKVLALALTNLLTTKSSPVYQHLPRIMVNILEALNDITKNDENDVPVDSLVLTENQVQEFYDDHSEVYQTDHEHRKKQLILADPVHTTLLKNYLQSQLMEMKMQLGQEQYEQLIQTIDADTLSQLKDYVTF